MAQSDTEYRTSWFLIEKAEGLDTQQHAHWLRCVCPYPHVPFRCSAQLHCAFLCSCKPVCGNPSCISPLKHYTQACSFMALGCFLWVCICAPFLCWFRAHTCVGLYTKHFLGLNNAWECPHACPFIPQASPHLALQNTWLSNTCFVFVLLTSNLPRLFYSAEYEIMTVVWQCYQRSPNYWIHSFFGVWLCT